MLSVVCGRSSSVLGGSHALLFNGAAAATPCWFSAVCSSGNLWALSAFECSWFLPCDEPFLIVLLCLGCRMLNGYE